MADQMVGELPRALGQIPSGLFLLTTAYDGYRSGVLVNWVQRFAAKPPMVIVAMSKGLPVEPLIRDSRCFALCQIAEDDRLLQRKFATPPDAQEDPFVTLATIEAPSGSPIVKRAVAYLDCELVRHIDLETDHALYVGKVRQGGVLNEGRPAVFLRDNGLVA